MATANPYLYRRRFTRSPTGLTPLASVGGTWQQPVVPSQNPYLPRPSPTPGPAGPPATARRPSTFGFSMYGSQYKPPAPHPGGTMGALAQAQFGISGPTLLPPAFWQAIRSREEQRVAGEMREAERRLREQAIAGGWYNTGIYQRRLADLRGRFQTQLARARQMTDLQQAEAERADRWRYYQMLMNMLGGMTRIIPGKPLTRRRRALQALRERVEGAKLVHELEKLRGKEGKPAAPAQPAAPATPPAQPTQPKKKPQGYPLYWV